MEDAAFAQLSFASGAIGQYVFSWGAHGEQFHIPGGRLIWGSRGSLHGRRLTLDGAASGAGPEDVVQRFKADAPEAHARQFPFGLEDDPP